MPEAERPAPGPRGGDAPAPPQDWRAADLRLLEEAAREAGRLAMRRFGGALDSWDKGGGQGPVSEADLEIDRMLRAELRAARPDYGWLSEETEDDPARLDAERVFVVDPIDGTRAFIAGQPTFAHSLAVVEGGRPQVGVVFLPARERMFAARAGAGSTLNGARLTHGGRETLEGAAALTGAAQLAPELWPGGPPPVRRHFRSSLAYRLCLVGSGRFDAMITLRDAWEWDVAAGELIAAEAGAVVTDARGAPTRYNGPRARLPGMIAAAPALHPQIMARLRRAD
ncbi:inositol monophosphatase family protein [Oceanicella actignis]|uniref:Myo-inositol-1(Or 4)-monophosphatase n=1 Tax=Oceanicella actignis TaxID=1189325 RepID=A0A1M7RRP6_9RHOB|nr:myo-inositol-1(or 4)-monophosphatase [Oceanicella actignis]SHN48983.1 myo-inositol-1(or 4)-monophosphatase [Oceanicella actignis]